MLIWVCLGHSMGSQSGLKREEGASASLSASWVQVHCHQQPCVSPALMDQPHPQTGRQMKPLPHRRRLPLTCLPQADFRSLFYAHVPVARWDPVALLPQHYWDNKLPKTWMSTFITKETWEDRSALTSCINVWPKLTLCFHFMVLST